MNFYFPYSNDIILFLFGFILLLAFTKFLLYPKVDEYIKKIIGGISILTFALATKNYSIITVAIFIGGLLIATENFLIHLAGIFSNKKGEDLTSLMNSFNRIPSSEKIFEEKITEQEKITKIEESELSNNTDTTKSDKVSWQEIARTEGEILDTFNDKYISNYDKVVLEKDVKVKSSEDFTFLDGVIKKDGETIYGIEISLYRKETKIPLLVRARKIIEKVRYAQLPFPVIVIFAGKSFENSQIGIIKDRYSKANDVIFLFYEYGNSSTAGRFLNDVNLKKINESSENSQYGKVISVDKENKRVTVLFDNGQVKIVPFSFCAPVGDN